jgi:NAD(P)-dependent dehydrogenase (short-subunit alcohol dehydrogenase family)
MESRGTVSVITGGAGGMGLATAVVVGRDHHVVLSDVRRDRLDRAVEQLTDQGISCEADVCDITDRAAVDRLVRHAATRGTIASVVHTAGVSPQMGAAEMIMRINALGTVNITEAFLAVATTGSCLVNVASMAGHLLPGPVVPRRGFSYALTDERTFLAKMLRRCRLIPPSQRSGIAYSISKAFVIWYSRTMAARFGAKGARIVSVSPGSFDTEMGRLEEKSGAGAMLRFGALPRFGRVGEIAEVLAFCASDKPGYLTGTDILCDGGVVAGTRWKDLLRLSAG